MALSIKGSEADQLARALAKLTGENLTQAVTNALRERLVRERARRLEAQDLPSRLEVLAQELRPFYDRRPIGRAEWNSASGDEE